MCAIEEIVLIVSLAKPIVAQAQAGGFVTTVITGRDKSMIEWHHINPHDRIGPFFVAVNQFCPQVSAVNSIKKNPADETVNGVLSRLTINS